MKSRAAVAFGPGQPLKIVEIDVAPPKKGEVLVKITHTGVCHTCLLYTSDAADDLLCVDFGGRPIIKKKNRDTEASSRLQ